MHKDEAHPITRTHVYSWLHHEPSRVQAAPIRSNSLCDLPCIRNSQTPIQVLGQIKSQANPPGVPSALTMGRMWDAVSSRRKRDTNQTFPRRYWLVDRWVDPRKKRRCAHINGHTSEKPVSKPSSVKASGLNFDVLTAMSRTTTPPVSPPSLLDMPKTTWLLISDKTKPAMSPRTEDV